MNHIRLIPWVLAFLVTVPSVYSQQNRPIPYPVFTPAEFDDAVRTGTRTSTGEPGPNYWTNFAEYEIDATLSPDQALLTGSQRAVYHNNSPDSLRTLYVHLRQNLNKEGAVRNRPQQLTGGVVVGNVALNGTPLVQRESGASPGYSVDGTVMQIQPVEAVTPGDTVRMDIDWSFRIPEAGAPRMGQDGEVFYLGYWYPQFAVYDDIEGWRADQYFGNGEFYMGYANYDVRITVPADFLVRATGVLQNPGDILSDEVRDRLKKASRSEEIMQIVAADDRGEGSATQESDTGVHTWHFSADNVRDFAFGASALYVWDAVRANAGDVDLNGRDNYIDIHALYRPGTSAWDRAAEFGKFSIEHLADNLVPYPYPHMSVVEGIIGGGMEYPMITLIGGDRNHRRLFGTTYHEIAHMWFPMLVGQNEKRYTWMDEGLTSFNTNDGSAVFWEEDSWDPSSQSYYSTAGSSDEVMSMRHGDEYPYGTPARGIASYNKPAVWFHALRGVLGEERFETAYREYARRWTNRHPQPYDLFNTFEQVTGRDLDWFWTTAFFTTWTMDQAITEVVVEEERVVVTVEDKGLAPLPSPVRVTYADGTTEDRRLPVSVWLDDQREARIDFPAGQVVAAEIDPDRFLPDVDRSNNRWEVGE